MRLFIAEKPNLAKAIANGLGNGRTESGCIRCGKDVVTWCFGHMLELAWPQDYSPEYAQWRREHLPIIPSEWKYHVKKDAAKQLAVIGSLLREADSVVNAGDPDREGQLLVDEVLEHFSYHGPVARIWLPSLDDRSVSQTQGCSYREGGIGSIAARSCLTGGTHQLQIGNSQFLFKQHLDGTNDF